LFKHHTFVLARVFWQSPATPQALEVSTLRDGPTVDGLSINMSDRGPERAPPPTHGRVPANANPVTHDTSDGTRNLENTNRYIFFRVTWAHDGRDNSRRPLLKWRLSFDLEGYTRGSAACQIPQKWGLSTK
jgi:hypothetical protein